MANLRVLPQRPTQSRLQWLKLTVAASVCGLGAALSLLTPELKVFPLQPLALPLTQLADLPTLRLPISLANGTDIEPPQGERGYSKLTVENGNSVDAVVKLVDQATGRTLRFVYVKAGEEVTLDNLGAYTTELKFALGVDWDEQKKLFRHNQSLMAFSEPVKFTLERRNDGEYWRTYTVTLHPVLNGDAKTERLDEKEF
ncbi:MAG TPA: hypothetical protein V6D29_10025 [Leptolyngbyaceae cyanobacterium]